MAKVLYYPKFKNRLIYPEAGDTGNRAPALVQWPPRTMIFHSAVGSGSLYNYFNNPNQNLESHSWIDEDGTGENYLQADRRADANLDANGFAYSVETADNGDPDNFPWTDDQCDTIVDMMVWGHNEWDIPIKRCPAWDKPGMGYHTMFGAPSHWTPVAKSCPGTARKKQFDGLIKRAQDIVNKPPVVQEEDDMPQLSDLVPVTGSAARFLEARGAVLQDKNGNRVPMGKDGYLKYEWFVVWGYIELVQNNEAIAAANQSLNAIEASAASVDSKMLDVE